jgi:hypothetical protein
MGVSTKIASLVARELRCDPGGGAARLFGARPRRRPTERKCVRVETIARWNLRDVAVLEKVAHKRDAVARRIGRGRRIDVRLEIGVRRQVVWRAALQIVQQRAFVSGQSGARPVPRQPQKRRGIAPIGGQGHGELVEIHAGIEQIRSRPLHRGGLNKRMWGPAMPKAEA